MELVWCPRIAPDSPPSVQHRYNIAQLGGKQRYVYGDTRSEVVGKLDCLKQGAVGGSLPDQGKRTVGDLLDGRLSHVAGTLKPRTVADYQAIGAPL